MDINYLILEVSFIIVFYFLVLGMLIGGFIFTNKYEKNFINIWSKHDYPLNFFYPMCLYILDKCKLHSYILSINAKDALDSINIGKDKEIHLRLYWCKKCSYIIIGLILVTAFSIFNEMSSSNKGELIGRNIIQRPSYGEGGKEVNLNIEVEDEGGSIKDKLDFNIEERRYDNEAIMTKLKEAMKYIDAHILGDNESLDNIRYPLNLVREVPGTSIKVKWELDDKNIIDSKGYVKNDNINGEGELIEIIACFEYYEIVEKYPITLKVKPKVFTKEEQTIKELKDAIENQSKETLTKDKQSLPVQLGNKRVYYNEPEERNSEKIFLIGIFIVGFIYFLMDKELLDHNKKRETQALIDYPEIINKFVLLLGAGMTMKNAWGKISKEYSNKAGDDKRKRYAYEEMIITYNELNNGVIETKSYENYGKRMKVLPYLRFSSLISQNLKKGSKGLLELLEYEAMDAFNERKELAKRLGEEASTKLLVPMMLMLLIVLAIVMVPALIEL